MSIHVFECEIPRVAWQVFTSVNIVLSSILVSVSCVLIVRYIREKRKLGVPFRLLTAAIFHLCYDVTRFISLETSIIGSLAYTLSTVSFLEFLRGFILQLTYSILDTIHVNHQTHEELESFYYMIATGSTALISLGCVTITFARLYGVVKYLEDDIEAFNSGSVAALIGYMIGILGVVPSIDIFTRKISASISQSEEAATRGSSSENYVAKPAVPIIFCLSRARRLMAFSSFIGFVTNLFAVSSYLGGKEAAIKYSYTVFWCSQIATVATMLGISRFFFSLTRPQVHPIGTRSTAFEDSVPRELPEIADLNIHKYSHGSEV